MPAGRDAVRMSAEEVTAFLADHDKVQVATVGREGTPHLATMFYVVDEGRIAFWTYARSQKAVNLRRDDRITCLVEDGTAYDELRGVSVSGRALVSAEPDDVRRIGGLVVGRMTGAADAADQLVERQAPKRVAVWVVAERVASWDHAKAGS